jgi:hypothetical protein
MTHLNLQKYLQFIKVSYISASFIFLYYYKNIFAANPISSIMSANGGYIKRNIKNNTNQSISRLLSLYYKNLSLAINHKILATINVTIIPEKIPVFHASIINPIAIENTSNKNITQTIAIAILSKIVNIFSFI